MAAKVEEKKVEKKEIILASSNPHLSIFPLGVHFTEGRFKTTDRDLADKVLTFDGVFEL